MPALGFATGQGITESSRAIDKVPKTAPLAVNHWDIGLFLALNAAPDAPAGLLATARFLSEQMPALMLAATGLWALRGDPQRRELFRVLPAMGMAWLATRAIRWGIPVDRPFVAGLGVQGIAHAASASFPSLHAAVAGSWAAALLLGRTVASSWIGPLALTIALAIGWSRVFLGLHYPSDVIAGLLLGCACAQLTHSMAPRCERAWDRLRLRFAPWLATVRKPGRF